ncbi:hypothetical protein EJB05_44964, partial [Eragrostis curvula]
MDSPSMYYYYYVLLFALILYLTKCYIASASSCNRSIRLPPGPWQLPVIGCLHHLLGVLPHRSLRRLSSHYGPLMFLKLGEIPVLIVSSREGAKEVMKTHDATFASRPQTAMIKILTKQGQAIALTPYGNHWRQLRKICVLELLSTSRVQSFRLVREEEVARLVQAISSKSASLVNISELVAAYVADTTISRDSGEDVDEDDDEQQPPNTNVEEDEP